MGAAATELLMAPMTAEATGARSWRTETAASRDLRSPQCCSAVASLLGDRERSLRVVDCELCCHDLQPFYATIMI